MTQLGDQDVAALIARLRADPDNADLYGVYSDWLQARGDPRGELIAIQAEMLRLAKLTPVEGALLEDHADALLGPLVDYRGCVTLDWQLGFVKRLDCEFSGIANIDALISAVAAFMTHPSGQVLQHLTAESLPHTIPHDLSSLVAEIATRGVPDSLRSLRLGPAVTRLLPASGLWVTWGDVAPLLASTPRLTSLHINGRARLGDVALDCATEVSVTITADALDAVACLRDAGWPALESLTLGMCSEQSWDSDQVAQLAALFARRFDQLRSLCLINCPVPVCAAVLRSPALAGLTTLRLHANLDRQRADALAHAILDARDQLGHLDVLDVRGNMFSPAADSELAGLPMDVRIDAPAPDTQLMCSFCGKSRREVRQLIAGPSVFICDECIGLCADIITEAAQEDE